MISAQDRVTAGMTFLDEHTPNHVETFDPSDFHIMTRGGEETERGFRRCALMQATDSEYWFSALRAAGIDQDQAPGLGFYPLGEDLWGEDATAFEQDIDDLNATWLAAYAERKAA